MSAYRFRHVAMTKQYMFLIQSSRSAKEPIQLPRYKKILLPPFLQRFYPILLARGLKANMNFRGDGPSCVVDFRDPGVRTPECGWSRVRCF